MTATIDLNADLGESLGAGRMGDDEAMLGIVTSANVACGFHAGDPLTTMATCRAAADRGIAIGAHPSYRDLLGFGRREMVIGAGELEADLLYQLGALEAFCRVAGTRIAYVKPHGALYNRIVHDTTQARAVVSAVRRYDASLPILGLPGSEVLRLAEEEGLRPVREAFADRAYTPQGTLVPRSEQGSVLHDPRLVADRMVRLVTTGTVEAVDGTVVEVAAESLCTHGDSPGAVEMAGAVRAALAEAGVTLAPFAP